MSKGFTLIETIIALAIFSIGLAAVSSFITYLYRTQAYSMQQGQAINEARQGIETMVKEIREARNGEDGSYPLMQAADSEFTFFSDIDDDGLSERVRYFREDLYFKKGIIKPTGKPLAYDDQSEQVSILSEYVRNAPEQAVFTYFDKNGSLLPAPARLQETRLMHLFLLVNVDVKRPPQNFVLETDVGLRNLNLE